MAHWKNIKKMGKRCVTEKGRLTKSSNCKGGKKGKKAAAKGGKKRCLKWSKGHKRCLKRAKR